MESYRQIEFPVSAPNLCQTSILDHQHARIRAVVENLRRPYRSDRSFVQSAHGYLSLSLKPVYTIDEYQPASETLRKGAGSCSQRMACLEAVSRSYGIGTRVRGIWVKGSFWYPRFRLSRQFIPARILLAWPQFNLEGCWIDFDELYGNAIDLAARSSDGFSNAGETLFEAVEHTAVDFLGKTRQCGTLCSGAKVDLSDYVVKDEGLYNSRDELFKEFGSLQHSLRGRAFELIYGGRKSI